jgi:PPM family protein phosphatase
MNISRYTEQGYGHVNEDAIAALRHPTDSSVLMCALADGQGGRSGAGAAAQNAVRLCLEFAVTYSPGNLADPLTWVSICEATDRKVSTFPEAGYTTLIGLTVAPTFVAGASSGDSAVALLHGDRFAVLTERQQKNPPLGSGACRPTPLSAQLSEPWKLLVVSDGVWKFVGWERMTRLMRSDAGDALVALLRDAAVESSAGRLVDDFSALVIEP